MKKQNSKTQINLSKVFASSALATGLMLSTALFVSTTSAVYAQMDEFGAPQEGFEASGGDPFAGLPPGALPGEAPQGDFPNSQATEFDPYAQPIPGAEGGLPPEGVPIEDQSFGAADPANASFEQGLPAGGFGLPTENIEYADPYAQAGVLPDVNLGAPVAPTLEFLTPAGEIPLQTMDLQELEASPSGVPRYALYSQTGEYDAEFAQCELTGTEGAATYSCNHPLYGPFFLHARKVDTTIEYYHSSTGTAEFGLELEGEEEGGFLSRFGFGKSSASATLGPDEQKKFRTYIAARGIALQGMSFENDFTTFKTTTTTGFGYGGSIAAGVRFNLGVAALRAEAEAGYKQAAVDNVEKTNGFVAGTADGSVTMSSAMLNGIIELMPNGKFNPYVGAGVGQTNFKFDFSDGGTQFVNDSVSALTYQAMVGAKYNINQNLSVFGEYRFVTAPGVEIPDFVGGTTSNDYKNNEFAVGVAYHF